MDQLSRLGALYSAVVADALDAIGLRDRTLAPGLVPLGGAAKVAGRAATLRVVAVDAVPARPYAVQFAAVDALRPGDLMVVETPPERPSAFWGELITTRALVNGCVGALVDGYSRDVEQIRRRGFPLWARGTHPADSAGRLDAVARDVAVTVGGVRVEPGDLVLADVDGVVVVPAARAAEVIAAAEVKAGVEDTVRAELAGGHTIVETYAKHGVM